MSVLRTNASFLDNASVYKPGTFILLSAILIVLFVKIKAKQNKTKMRRQGERSGIRDLLIQRVQGRLWEQPCLA